MSKRTDTDSRITLPSDFWPTPPEAVTPLLEPLRQDVVLAKSRFIEPCAGDGALMDVLVFHNFVCAVAFDTAPRRSDIRHGDATTVDWPTVNPAIPAVTNPPWARHLLEPILAAIIGTRIVWLLLPLDMAANLWTNPYMRHVNRIVPLGRVSWLGNGKAGMENSVFFRFDPQPQDFITERKPK